MCSVYYTTLWHIHECTCQFRQLRITKPKRCASLYYNALAHAENIGSSYYRRPSRIRRDLDI